MKATPLAIRDVMLIEHKAFGDDRGFFFESFNQAKFEATIGRQVNFVQDNHSHSAKNVLRCLHYQIQQPQGKLVRVMLGEVFDAAVDLRNLPPPSANGWAKSFPPTIKKAMGARRLRTWLSGSFSHRRISLQNHRFLGAGIRAQFSVERPDHRHSMAHPWLTYFVR